MDPISPSQPPSRRRPTDRLPLVWHLLPILVSWVHVLVSPDTKVEESFALHAVHDFVLYGTSTANLDKFDHATFPGPLPRSFLPSLALAWPVRILAGPLVWAGLITNKFHLQILTRLVLALISSISLLFVGRRLAHTYGRTTAKMFLLLCATQFHLLYYAGRTLPNFLALPFVNLSLGLLLAARFGPALAVLTATAAVVRSELALLLAPVVLLLLGSKRISVLSALSYGSLGGFSGMAATVAVDSTYWSQPYLWPELYTIYFNVVLGKASEWGISPWYHYIKSLPLLLLATFPLMALGVAHPVLRLRTWPLVVPPAVMIAGMSLLGHKEWRFIAYAIVWFNAAGAIAGGWIWTNRRKSWVSSLLALGLVGTLVASACVSVCLTVISAGNYPGGEIMRLLHSVEEHSTAPVYLYSPSLPLQTGSTLFHALRVHTEAPSRLPYPPSAQPYWTYDKTEFSAPLDAALATEQGFTHVVLEQGLFERDGWETHGWESVGTRSGFGGVAIVREGAESEFKHRWIVPGLAREVLVKKGTTVELIRRVGFGGAETIA